jgi:hypothetical protein
MMAYIELALLFYFVILPIVPPKVRISVLLTYLRVELSGSVAEMKWNGRERPRLLLDQIFSFRVSILHISTLHAPIKNIIKYFEIVSINSTMIPWIDYSLRFFYL